MFGLRDHLLLGALESELILEQFEVVMDVLKRRRQFCVLHSTLRRVELLESDGCNTWLKCALVARSVMARSPVDVARLDALE